MSVTKLGTNERPARLIMLPNNDLWRGRVEEEMTERADTVDASGPATPEDAVMEMFQSQKGESIHCHWCGMEFSRKQFNEINEHVAKLHPTALKPPTPEETGAAFEMANAIVTAKIDPIKI